MAVKPFRVGVVGVGYWGPKLARTFAAIPGCEVSYICDRRRGRLEALAAELPGTRMTTDYEDLLNDPDLTAVAIATPATTHGEMGLAALHAGKHVLVEKPLATCVGDATDLVRTAEQKNLCLAVGHVYLHHPVIDWLRTATRFGRLGSLTYAESVRINLGPPHADTSVLWDLGSHDISILMGLAGTPVAEVNAQTFRLHHDSHDDLGFITLRFVGGFVGQIHVSWLSPIKERRLLLVGRSGSAVFDDTLANGKLVVGASMADGQYDPNHSYQTWENIYSPLTLEQPSVSPVLPLTVQCIDFMESARAGRRPLVDASFALDVVRVLEAAEKSALLRSSVAVMAIPAEVSGTSAQVGDEGPTALERISTQA